MIVLLEYLALIVQDLLSKLVVLPIYKSSAVEWLALLRRIREVRDSNPGPETLLSLLRGLSSISQPPVTNSGAVSVLKQATVTPLLIVSNTRPT
jgi:hypothetical protein